MKKITLIMALAALAAPAMAIDYLVYDLDGYGTTKCAPANAVEVSITRFDYSEGDRTFMCLPPLPKARHDGIRGWSVLPAPIIAAPEAPAPPLAAVDPEEEPGIPATPLLPASPAIPATPLEPATPIIPATPLEPATPVAPDPGECQSKRDCAVDPKPEPDRPQPCSILYGCP